ncbi:dehydroascorbate reductase 2 [Tanacetum coccineum]
MIITEPEITAIADLRPTHCNKTIEAVVYPKWTSRRLHPPADKVTAVFMDTSEWMGHNRSDRFLDQVDAIEVYCQKKLKSHPDNHVTIFATGRTGFGCLVEPTRHLSKIMDGVCGFRLFGGTTDLQGALQLAKFRCFNLTKKYKNINLLKNILVFAGGPVAPFFFSYSIELGEMLADAGITLDVVNYGTQPGGKTELLNHLVSNANVDIRCRILDLQHQHRLYKYDILPLVGEGGNFDRKTRLS